MKIYKTSELCNKLNVSTYYLKLLVKEGKIIKHSKGKYSIDEEYFKDFNSAMYIQEKHIQAHKKQSESLRNYMQSRTEEQKQAFKNTMSIASKKMWQDDELRKKHKESCVKAQNRPEVKEKNSKAQLKRFESAEARQVLSEAQIKAWSNEDTRHKRSEGLKLANAREETKAKRSETMKRIWQNAEHKKQRSAKIKQTWQNEELRKQQGVRSSNNWKNPEYRNTVISKAKETWHKPENQERYRQIRIEVRNRPDVIQKMDATKRRNGTFTTSKDEQRFLQELLDLGLVLNDTLIKEKYYPNTHKRCDFYIVPLDLYVELQYAQYHMHEPFDKNNEEHLQILQKLKDRTNALHSKPNARRHNQYDKMIEVWTVRDAEKIKYAKELNLNLVLIYTYEQEQEFLIRLKELV